MTGTPSAAGLVAFSAPLFCDNADTVCNITAHGEWRGRSEPLRTFLIKCLQSESERLVHREGSGKAENGLDYAVTLEKRAKECSKLATVALFLHP